MSKLQRLRWIPMIFQAFHEAQLRRDPISRGSDISSNIGQKDIENPNMGTSKVLPMRTKFINGKRKDLPKSMTSRSQLTRQKPALRAVLRELRVTKKKLHELESVHTQLSDMQQRLESQLETLSKQVQRESSEENHRGQSTVDTSTIHTGEPSALPWMRIPAKSATDSDNM